MSNQCLSALAAAFDHIHDVIHDPALHAQDQVKVTQTNIGIYAAYPPAEHCQCRRQVSSRRRLADSPFTRRDCDYLCSHPANSPSFLIPSPQPLFRGRVRGLRRVLRLFCYVTSFQASATIWPWRTDAISGLGLRRLSSGETVM